MKERNRPASIFCNFGAVYWSIRHFMLGMHASSIWRHLGALNRHQYIILVMNKEGKFLKQLSQQKIWCSPVRKTICEYLKTRHYSRIFWHFPKRKSEVFPLFSSRQIEACVPLSSSFPSQLTLVLSRCGRQFCGYQESWQCKLEIGRASCRERV